MRLPQRFRGAAKDPPVAIDDPRLEGWENRQHFEIRAPQWRGATSLRALGVDAACVAPSHPLDRRGRGDIYLVVAPKPVVPCERDSREPSIESLQSRASEGRKRPPDHRLGSDGDTAFVDGALTPLSDARIPVTDEGLLRGDGVFEVMRLYDGVPFARQSHLRADGELGPEPAPRARHRRHRS